MTGVKRFQQYIITVIIVPLLATLTWGAAHKKAYNPTITSAKIGKKELVGATGVTIIKGDLTREGKVVIRGKAMGGVEPISTVEVSLDAGRSWQLANGKEEWEYRFKPLPQQTYYLTFRTTDAAGVTSPPTKVVPLTYLPITLWELIQRQADLLAKAYMSRDLERYMGLISTNYQQYPRGNQRLRRLIARDFRSLNNIVLHLRVDQVYELEGAIMAEVRWQLTYAGLPQPEHGYVEIHFDPVDQLKVLLQEKDLYFGAASRRSP